MICIFWWVYLQGHWLANRAVYHNYKITGQCVFFWAETFACHNRKICMEGILEHCLVIAWNWYCYLRSADKIPILGKKDLLHSQFKTFCLFFPENCKLILAKWASLGVCRVFIKTQKYFPLSAWHPAADYRRLGYKDLGKYRTSTDWGGGREVDSE